MLHGFHRPCLAPYRTLVVIQLGIVNAPSSDVSICGKWSSQAHLVDAYEWDGQRARARETRSDLPTP
jgi:hypothetical protein